jgi:hypothetical protein
MIKREVCYIKEAGDKDLEGLVIAMAPPGFPWGPVERGLEPTKSGAKFAVKTVKVKKGLEEDVAHRKVSLRVGADRVRRSSGKLHVKIPKVKTGGNDGHV